MAAKGQVCFNRRASSVGSSFAGWSAPGLHLRCFVPSALDCLPRSFVFPTVEVSVCVVAWDSVSHDAWQAQVIRKPLSFFHRLIRLVSQLQCEKVAWAQVSSGSEKYLQVIAGVSGSIVGSLVFFFASLSRLRKGLGGKRTSMSLSFSLSPRGQVEHSTGPSGFS